MRPSGCSQPGLLQVGMGMGQTQAALTSEGTLAQNSPVRSMIWGSEVDLKPHCDADMPGEPDGENFEGALK